MTVASVVEVQTEKPNVLGATIKFSRSDLNDLKLFVREWYARNARFARLEDNATYKAILAALDGKTDVQIASPKF